MRNRKLWASVLAGILALIMVLSLVIGVLPGMVSAKSSSEIANDISKLKDQKKEFDEKIADLEGQISDNASEIQELVAQKNIIDQEVFLLHEQVRNLNDQINAYNLLIADKQEELDEAEAKLAKLNEENKERIRAMEEQGNLTYWSVIFKANSFTDLLDRMNMIEEIAAADRRRLDEIGETAKIVAEAKDSLEAEKKESEAAKAELEKAQETLEQKQADANALLGQLVAKGAEYEALLHDAESDSAKLGLEIDDLEDELEKKRREEWLATSQPPTPNSPPDNSSNNTVVSDATWVTPCNYVMLTSPFGWRIHPIYGDWRFHYGVDLAGPQGTPIVATRSGVVETASYDGSSGYYVTINHQDGFKSKYLHLTHYIVAAGDYVTAGQVIGYMGSTGASTGSHLHFSIIYNGSHVNPMDYI